MSTHVAPAATAASRKPVARPSNDWMSRRAHQLREPGVSERQEVFRRHSPARHVVVGDGRNAAAGKLAHGEHGRHLLGDPLEQGSILVATCGGDDAVDALGEQLLTHLREFVGGVPGLGHDREEIPRTEPVRDAAEHRADEGVAEVGDDDADGSRASSPQRRRLEVRPVPERLGRLDDSVAGRPIDERAPIGAERPGCRRDVDARTIGNIFQGYVRHPTPSSTSFRDI